MCVCIYILIDVVSLLVQDSERRKVKGDEEWEELPPTTKRRKVIWQQQFSDNFSGPVLIGLNLMVLLFSITHTHITTKHNLKTAAKDLLFFFYNTRI